VRKKVYKKKKKVVETVIFQYTPPDKRLHFSTLFAFAGIFLAVFLLYYLFFSFTFNSVFSNTMTMSGISVYLTKSTRMSARPLPLPLSIQTVSLHKKESNAVASSDTAWVADNIDKQRDQIIWHGPRDKKEIALTFDADITPIMVDWVHDGQIATYDDTQLTNYLMQNNIKATFFLTGLWIQLYPDATKELADNSLFELENHSYSHPSMAGYCFDQPQVPQSQYPYEIEKTQQLIEQYTHAAPKYFRFPGGCYDQADLNLVKKEGLVTVHWDDVADDGFNNNEQAIIHNVLSEAKPGGIIVMHMGSPTSNVPQTYNALPTIITSLKKQGYTFVTVSELLNPTLATKKINPKKYLLSLQTFHNVFPNSL
jgi:peptidoglycan-N-acetylglucosamine deacetylase